MDEYANGGVAVSETPLPQNACGGRGGGAGSSANVGVVFCFAIYCLYFLHYLLRSASLHISRIFFIACLFDVALALLLGLEVCCCECAFCLPGLLLVSLLLHYNLITRTPKQKKKKEKQSEEAEA